MAPPRPPPPLTDDLVSEILLRLPPDEPGRLFRACLVCKPWRDLLSEPGFCRRYRAFHHRTPPVLGFLRCNSFVFTSTAASQLCPPVLDSLATVGLDCRHGRVLLHSIDPTGLLLWDPISGNEQLLPEVPRDPTYNHITGAVLCATDGCNHIDCREGPFLVVFAATADEEVAEDVISVTWVSVYLSETGAWSAPASIHLGPISRSREMMGPSVLVGDALYFLLEDGRRILKYELGSRGLSVMNAPPLRVGNMALVKAEDGGLGAAGVKGYGLHLWSWKGGAAGAGWVKGRVIELDMMLSMGIGDPSTKLLVVGFSEGANTIFVSSNAGIFAVDLKSDRIKKISEGGDFSAIMPYAGFYTPDYASWGLQLQPHVRMQ
ncbi:hypothetical protein BS78_02G191900 [Paspalum vaginatum]|nr:hypothetical protein BS78_02G191900 [Paspalum vaginatum]